MNNNDELPDLSALWQSSPAPAPLDITRLQQRYQKQRWIMGLNMVLESLSLAMATLFAVYLYVNAVDAYTMTWVGLFTLWGWTLFFPLNISRWKSFRLMKDVTLQESIQQHLALIEQEIRRWRISTYATVFLLVALVTMTVVKGMNLPLTITDVGIDAGIAVLLSLCSWWFRHKRKQAEVALAVLKS